MLFRRPGLGALTATVLLALVVPTQVAATAAPAAAVRMGSTGSTGSAPAGPAALRELRSSGGLVRAAERAGMSAARLSRVLSDPTSRFTERGAVFYAEERRAEGATATRSGASGSFTPVAPLADSFKLHSRPGSTRKILLDFNGQTVSDTWWNEPAPQGGGLANGSHAAWSLDGDPAFSDAERLAVQEVWARVSEDYAPFDVDVTTQDPGLAALDRTSTADSAFGVRVLVTGGTAAADTICGGGCAGVAWLDVFDYDINSFDGVRPGPAWVFTDLTWDNTAWEIADIASHEAGHTLNLEHDGQGALDYYEGRGIWGPIMGATPRPLVQWSNGDYTGATQTQDDLAVISANGAPRLADDYGGTVAAVSPAPGSLGSGAEGSASGVVTDRTDKDVLAYTHGACPVTFTVTTATPAPDLDARLRVLAADGTVIASVDPPAAKVSGEQSVTGTGATWTGDLPAGTTYVEVDGVGQGAMPDAGYSDYGSVGRWTVTAQGCSPAPPGATAPQAPTGLTLDVDGSTGDVVATWAAPADDGGTPVTGYAVTVTSPGGTTTRTATAPTLTLRGLAPEATHTVTVRAVNLVGPGPEVSDEVTFGPRAPSAPGSPTLTRTTTPGTATLSWAAPAQTWGHDVTGYSVSSPALGPEPVLVAGRSTTVTGLTDLESATYTVQALSEVGAGLPASATLTYHAPRPPSVPRSVRAASGAAGGLVTARVSWVRPLSDGGTPVTRYRVWATRYDAAGRALRTWTKDQPASARAWVASLPRGTYRFRVAALNLAGRGPVSARTNLVRAR